jgi:hypothetical protein
MEDYGQEVVMYKDDPDLEKPSGEARIWRYMDFSKFVSLLYKSALFFARVDQLDDPFEGSFPRVNVELRPQVFKDKMPPKDIEYLSEFYKQFVTRTFVNCWHVSPYQSAMWKLYLQSNEGIAILSSFNRLKDSLTDADHDIYIGNVKYINYKKDIIPEGSLFPYFHKRKSFEHEQELRVVIQAFSYDQKGEIDWSRSPHRKGLYVPVNLDLLIDRIILAPSCSPWQKAVVKSVVKKYGLDKRVLHSLLYVSDERIVY